MRLGRHDVLAAAAAACLAGLALAPGAASADDKTYVMKITTPTINDVPDTYGRMLAAALEKDSGGRIKAEVYPASQLGSIPRQIEGTQFGAIQCAIIPPEFFVGVDERFEVMAAPGLVDSLAHGQRVAGDAAVRKLMLGLGADKGLHGAGLFIAEPSVIVSREPIRRLADFRGKKLRIFASQFQTEAWRRLGATPVAMTLGDVLPALQQGTIDGSVTGMGPVAHMHFNDAAKYVTVTNQPAVFLVVEVSRKWYDALPGDLQALIDKDAAAQDVAIQPVAVELRQKSEAYWASVGGAMIELPADERAAMMKTLASVGADVSRSKPALEAAYQVVAEAARRLRQAASQ